MNTVIGSIGIICGFSILLTALWDVSPYFRETDWFYNVAFWFIAILTVAASSLISYVGYRAICKPTPKNLEASACFSAIIVTSIIYVFLEEKFESSSLQTIVFLLLSGLVNGAVFLCIRKATQDKEA